jgi:hypothetical protein
LVAVAEKGLITGRGGIVKVERFVNGQLGEKWEGEEAEMENRNEVRVFSPWRDDGRVPVKAQIPKRLSSC